MEKNQKIVSIAKKIRKRCLSDLETTKRLNIFPDVPLSDLPQNLKIYIEQQEGSTGNVKAFYERPQAYLKIFTFQYLMLCFGNINKNLTVDYLELIYQLIEKQEFEFILPESPHWLSEQSHMSLKNIISQYFNYMSEYSGTIMSSLQKYPLIIDVFVAFFKTMLYLGDICCLTDESKGKCASKQQIFEFLTSYFEVQAVATNDMIVFKESKVYLYEDQKSKKFAREPKPIYMAYYEDSIYKIDDSKFSQLLNKQEQPIYKSGISSVKCLISDINIKSCQEIQEKDSPKKTITVNIYSPINQSEQLKLDQSNKIYPEFNSLNEISEPIRSQSHNNFSKFGNLKQCGSQFVDNSNKNLVYFQQQFKINQWEGQNKKPIDEYSEEINLRGFGKLINNLRHIDPKNVSYSYNEDSGQLKGHNNIQSTYNGLDKQNIAIQEKINAPYRLILDNVLNNARNQHSKIYDIVEKPYIQQSKEISAVKKTLNKEAVERGVYSPPESSAVINSIIDNYDFGEVKEYSKQIESYCQNSFRKLSKKSSFKTQKSTTSDSNYVPYVPININPPNIYSLIPFEKNNYAKKLQASSNITKQFTSSFLLNIITEPYRSSIKDRKQKARKNRKNARALAL